MRGVAARPVLPTVGRYAADVKEKFLEKFRGFCGNGARH
jgi:hypothetical protein